MKKLLSLLSSMTVAASAAMAVVSCSVPSTPIEVDFNGKHKDFVINNGGKDKDGNPNKYSMSDMSAAMMGNFTGGQEIGTMNFNTLNRGLLSLLSFNQSMIVKTQNNYSDVAAHRNLWQGRDQEEDIDKGVNPKDVPSVDGIKFNGVDDNYYGKFSKTQISSLKGLQDLAFHDDIKDNDLLKAQQDKAREIFGKSKDDESKKVANEFMGVLLDASGNPSFTKINYDIDTAKMVNYDPTSKLINPFNDIESAGTSFTFGDSKTYKELNDSIKEAPDKDGLVESSKKINERKTVDPYGALLLPMEDSTIDSPDIKIVQSKKDSDAKDAKDMILNSTITDASSNTSADLSGYAVETQNDKKFAYSFASNKFIAKNVDPINVTYAYDTKINKDGKPIDGNKEYKISFSIDGLKAIFMPQVYDVKTLAPVSAKPDKDNKKTIITFNINKKDFSDELKKEITMDGFTDITENKDDATVTYEVSGTSGSFTVKGRNYKYNTDNKQVTNFFTKALTWAFVGYKFFDGGAANGEYGKDIKKDENANALTGVQTMIKSDSKQEVFSSEIYHNYKDIKLGGIKIEEAK